MNLSIPYGEVEQRLSIPEDRFQEMLAAGAGKAGGGLARIHACVSSPAGHLPLSGFAAAGEPVLVLVNDATRPTPTAALLEALRDDISGWDLTFLVATGTHRHPSGSELRQMFGALWPGVRERVHIHDARDRSRLEPVGVTSSGNEVIINRLVARAKKILVISSVEPHYFAGYTGGRKIILPGVAGFETIERNHRLAMEPDAEVLRLEDNPVNREMEEALGFLDGKGIFAVLAVLDRGHRVDSVHCGEIGAAFRAAAREVDSLFAVPLGGKAEIVLAIATHPLDSDLYQAQKALENGALALREGGILILVSACREGVGNDAFLRIMEAAGSPAMVTKMARRDYHLGYHKAARLSALAGRAELWAVAGVPDDVIRTAFMRPFAHVQEAVDTALEARPKGRVAVLMDAGITVPLARENT